MDAAAAAGAVDAPADLEAARDTIAAATELNPDAHFGREAWQLLAIDWLLDGATIRANGDEEACHERMMRSSRVPSMLDHGIPPSTDVDGLVGIITLGGGWESIDVLGGLHRVLGDQGDHVVGLAVSCRINELTAVGRRPRHSATEMDMLARRGGVRTRRSRS